MNFKNIFLNFLSALIITVLILVVMPTQLVLAATVISVNTFDDESNTDGDCSLREAIETVNSGSQVDNCTDPSIGGASYTITVPAGTYTLSRELLTTANMTINGEGAGTTIIQANAALGVATYRVLHNNNGTVAISGLTIRHGVCFAVSNTCVASSEFGGGIYNEAGSLTLDASTISGNRADYGGGIFNLGTLTIQNGSSVGDTNSPNRVTNHGGGIFNNGTIVSIINSTISGNSANNDGGGIFNNFSATITSITHSTFSGNSATIGGGGIANNGTITSIANNTFSVNSAGVGGGGISNIAAIGIIANSTFSGNSADYGGGIFATFPGCFTAESQVLLTDGSSVSVSKIKVGDEVLSYDFEKEQQVSSIVTNIMSRPTHEILRINGLEVTREHPFAVGKDQWRTAGELQLGDRILSDKGWTTITNITSVQVDVEVYNITVEGMHNYYVSDGENHYLVHNKFIILDTIELNNNIITNSKTGGDCFTSDSSFTGSDNLIDDYDSGDCSGISGAAVTNISTTRTDNGGYTQTYALMAGSNAIDNGDEDTCSNAPVSGKDQRDVVRPTNACDIGAYEYSSDSTYPTVTSDSLVATYVTGPSTFTVTFSENAFNPSGNTNPDDVTNPNNYLLIEDGINGVFNTASCSSGLKSDDTQITISSVSYNGTDTTTVHLSTALPDGTYRLFVCGTTSIADLALNALNNGTSDYTFKFIVGANENDPEILPEILPATGFPRNVVTKLPPQPKNRAYGTTEINLEIPILRVEAPIVGVPVSKDGWDLTWLGNQAGWLNGTTFPSWAGNSALTAHVYDANGKPGLFNNLTRLKWGDEVIVHAYGQTYIYEVRSIDNFVQPDDTSTVYKYEDYPWLTLITCRGYDEDNDSYDWRVVVRAVQTKID